MQQVRDLSFSGWRDDAHTWPAVKHLEKHFAKIQAEVMAAYKSGKLSNTADLDDVGLHIAGDWREANFLIKGRPVKKTIDLLPCVFPSLFKTYFS